MMRKPLLAAILCALVLALPAWAQTYKDSGGTVVPGVVPIPATVGGTASLAVTNASGTVAIPASDSLYPSINLTNSGTVALYYALGATATTSSAYLAPGTSVCIAAGSATTVAAITASSTTTLQLTQTNSCLVGLNSGGSGGGGGGSGTVTSVATTCGTAGGPITTSGTISGALIFNVQTGTSYSTLATDCGKIVSFNNASAIAVTLNNATFSATNYVNIKVVSGSAVVTLTPSSGTIDGNANEPLTAKHSQTVVFDGTNWSTSGVYVVGPASATIGHLATFGDALGQSVVDGGAVPSGGSGAITAAYTTGASIFYPNPLFAGAGFGTGPVGVANIYYCTEYWLWGNVTIKALGLRVVTTSAGNSSAALQAAVYSDLVTTGNVHRPGALIDFTANFATGSATFVSAAMNNTTDALTGPGPVWMCVQKFDNVATFAAAANTTTSMMSALIGSATLGNVIGSTNLSAVNSAGTGYGGVNWVNFTSSTTWTEGPGVIAAPQMAIQVN